MVVKLNRQQKQSVVKLMDAFVTGVAPKWVKDATDEVASQLRMYGLVRFGDKGWELTNLGISAAQSIDQGSAVQVA